ncbi:putative N-acetyltransferase (TIGR04045 family) [Marmoricola sp. OAE513]|uniref:MSMEG_0567/sll0787 family protein n=1 Tax=Marmoricola sp. OAE513 TaxID=2817894 RepID=UPI001AE3F274
MSVGLRDSDVDAVVLLGHRPAPVIVETDDHRDLAAYRALRRRVFVQEQGLFHRSDADDVDSDPRTRVLVVRAPDGTVLGGVRIHPTTGGAEIGRDIGWWRGSRLVVAPGAARGTGSMLVRAACALAETAGALRFDATVQEQNEVLFTRLGWVRRGTNLVQGVPHALMDYPIARVQRLADATKAPLGGLLAAITATPYGGGGPGFVGDDAAPVPTAEGYSGLVAACDAILPSMVERDPEWAGWCAVLVNVNDLFAMGASPVGLLDAVGARDASFARRVLAGLTAAAEAWGVPVLGGHTQLGVPGSLSVTALGRTDSPVPGGGGQAGQRLRVTADLGGAWRPGYGGSQWDSSSTRTPAEMRALAGVVPALHPTAAKDVSMSGLVGTTGMLAEASGCGAVLDVADVPAPSAAAPGDWLTCFPGFAVVTAETSESVDALPDFVTTAVCGELVEGTGVGLRWPDGIVTEAVSSTVTGMGAA